MERDKALDMALGQIEKQFGKGSVMKMGEKGSMSVETISTGALALDIALGVGGLPRGRVVEIYGPESSGKSTLAMHVVAEAQRNGGICAYVDAEHAMDPVYANNIGVDIDELLISQPDTGEQALEITDMLVRSGAIDVIVIDSVAALTPRAEIEGEMGDSHVGLQARLMSQALRKLTANLNKSNTICIFINQLREKIGVMFGCPETTPGGRALKFYSSVRLDIRRIESIKDGVEVVGNRTRVKVVKNKVAPPFKQASSTSCTAGASAVRARCSTSASTSASSRSPVPGTPTRASSSGRAGRTPRRSCPRTPRSWSRSPSASSARSASERSMRPPRRATT